MLWSRISFMRKESMTILHDWWSKALRKLRSIQLLFLPSGAFISKIVLFKYTSAMPTTVLLGMNLTLYPASARAIAVGISCGFGLAPSSKETVPFILAFVRFIWSHYTTPPHKSIWSDLSYILRSCLTACRRATGGMELLLGAIESLPLNSWTRRVL